MPDWKTIDSISSNMILHGDGFYISYATGAGLGRIGLFTGDNSSDETALVIDGEYYILNGDFRKDYEKLVEEGAEACLSFFKKRDNVSSWSD